MLRISDNTWCIIWPTPCIQIPPVFVQKHDMRQDMSKLKLDQTPMQLKCKFGRWEIQTQIQPTIMWPISLHAWWSNKPYGVTWSTSLMAQYTIWLHYNLCPAQFDHNFIIKRAVNNLYSCSAVLGLLPIRYSVAFQWMGLIGFGGVWCLSGSLALRLSDSKEFGGLVSNISL